MRYRDSTSLVVASVVESLLESVYPSREAAQVKVEVFWLT
jgi:hypothetical protein